MDKNWKEHLKSMDDLKQSVQGAVYEQKDPLLIYKFESFKLFESLLDEINEQAISFLFKANLKHSKSEELKNKSNQQAFVGHASRGQEERMSPQAGNTQNQPKLSRRQRRAQERKMKR